jgi:signal transduction histidine kinase/phage shock protein PspC (stress-responsive transcriptional regulator)
VTPQAAAPRPEPAARPKLYRAADRRMLGGVARGLAAHLGIDVIVVRAAFVVLAFAAGFGIALYAAFWAFVPMGPGGRGEDRVSTPRQYVALGALTVGGIVAVQSIGLGIPGALLWPVALTGVGAAVLWSQADEAQRRRWIAAVGSRDGRPVAATVAGAALVVAGAGIFLAYHAQLSQVRDGLLAAGVMVAGVAIITGPWWLGTIQALTTERRARIREQERAEIAAHVHDSVLHTLALIQRNVDDPAQVQLLARSQERELRAWLYKPTTDDERHFAAALERMCAEVEDSNRITVEVVVVGECGLDDRLRAMLQAAREALVNAAKHAGTSTVSVYAEIEPGKVTVFVRDRGKGFDADLVPDDRLGVRESIVGRMERNGGKAFVRTSPGAGTEVQLEMPAPKTPAG